MDKSSKETEHLGYSEKLSTLLTMCSSEFQAEDEASARTRRAVEVKTKWQKAVEKVYKDVAPLILDHINAVYITKEEDGKHLYIYADDGLIRSDLDAKREFLKVALFAQGEEIVVYKIFPPKMDMKTRHLYRNMSDCDGESPRFSKAVKPLTPEEIKRIQGCSSIIENEELKKSFKAAMTAEIEQIVE